MTAPSWPGLPSEDIFITLGATFISHDSATIVEISVRRFPEDLLDEVLKAFDGEKFESLGQGKLN